MKKLSVIIVTMLLLVCAMEMRSSFGQAPPLSVNLLLDKNVYYPGEPIRVVMTLTQNTASEIYTSRGFGESYFHLFLYFTGPDGKVIRSFQLKDIGTFTPKPPPVFLLTENGEDRLIQGDPIEILPYGWIVALSFDAFEYYSLVKGGDYSVTGKISMRAYSTYETAGDTRFSRIATPSWQGTLESNTVHFTLVRDADNDGYYYPIAYAPHTEAADCNDEDATVNPGMTEIAGNGKDDDCNPATLDFATVTPGTINVKVEKHKIGTGSRPGSTKEPISGLPVNVYGKSPGSCVSQLGVSWQSYKAVWKNCTPSQGPTSCNVLDTNGRCVTSDSGLLAFSMPPGDYIIIGLFDPSTTQAGDELYIGVSAGGLDSGETMNKYLQVIEKGDGKKVPAKYTVVTGSELLIIEPEYVEWDGTKELYPFVFESLGDWTVTTAVSPPQGFVTDYKSLTESVNSEVEALQFTITDVGSKWIHTNVVHTIKHKNKTRTINSAVGVKLSERLAKQKKLGIFGQEDLRRR
jgi:hypothetical protein